MTTLFDVMLRAASELDRAFRSTATGGSATTLVDTACLDSADFWNEGTLFFISAATGRISTTAVITDWALAGSTFTFATGTAIAAGNTYLALPPKWSRVMLVQAINTALKGQTIVSENATTDIVADTLEYSLPAGVSDVIEVFSGSTADGWEEHFHWREQNGKIIFYKYEPSDTDYHIKLRYRTKHADVQADTAVIDAQINLDLLHNATLAELHRQYAQLTNDPDEVKLWQTYLALTLNKASRPQAAPRFANL